MTEKATIHFGEHLNALTAGLKGNSISARVNRTAERYSAIVGAHYIPMTEDEERVLRQRLNWIAENHSLDLTKIRFLYDRIEVPARREDVPAFRDSPAARSMIELLKEASLADLVATVERMGY
jgi:hypothetical protein